MQPNVGVLDAVVRWILATAAFTASLLLVSHTLLSFLLVLIAAGMAASALTHRCPVYTLVHIDTRRRAHRPARRA